MNDGRHVRGTRPQRARILVVDDHPIIRERLNEVIGAEPDLKVCGEAEDVCAALEAVARTRPQLAIVDLSLKRSHGLDLIKELHVRRPDLAILVLSVHDEASHAERAIRAGARGYISKQEATRKILEAIRHVLRGRVYLSEAVAARMSRPDAEPGALESRGPLGRLTDQELRVFELLGQGQSTRHIAQEMALCVATVETFRSRIKQKLGLEDANALRQRAIRWTQTGGLD